MAESWSRSEEIQEPKDTVEFGLDSQRVALGDRRHPVGPPPAAMMQATRAGDKCAGDKDAGDKDAGDKDAGGKATGDKDEATRMQATRAGDKGAGDKYAGDKCAGDKYAGDKYAGDKDAGGKATGSGDKDEGDKVATRMNRGGFAFPNGNGDTQLELDETQACAPFETLASLDAETQDLDPEDEAEYKSKSRYGV